MGKQYKIEIIKELKAHILTYYPVSELILFGSQARNEETGDSDYDVLIILNTSYNWQDERKIYSICGNISSTYNILIDVHILSRSELKTLRGLQPIYSNAVQEGIYA